ncbi:hypothetical protein ACN9ML_10640 [Dyadobacter endophyticus]|uniref:hypothetical protein n=1 Tax=Dyadobacter endophyticus TaxID=1749036 RepID=UPI003CE8C758
MGNDEGFRKIRDKLAGFESDPRDDSWQLFEKHRRRKDRNRKLAGAAGIGMLVLFILGFLIGSRIFLENGKRAVQQSNRFKGGIQKHRAQVENGKTDRSIDLQSRGVGYQRNAHEKAVSGKTPATFRVKTGIGLAGTASTIPHLMPSHNNSPFVISGSEANLPRNPGALLSRGPSLYAVKLGLPSIRLSEMNATRDTGNIGRGFHLSLGPAMRANYTRPSENRLTLGPAVFATFPIASKLSLRGGLALLREHAYVSNPDPEFKKDAVRWLTTGDYRWWDLDIPVDIQVALHHSPKFSLSGLFGVSSSLNWGEHFKELYRKDKIVTNTLALSNGEVREVQELVSKQEKPLTGGNSGVVFAPASYLSASILLEKKVTTRSSLLIEPQLCYPIGGVTSRNLRFTSIGLQIRILYK